jgi:hypothetical protein
LANNAAALKELDAWIEKIQSIPKLAEEAAPAVADVVRAEIQKTINAGTTAEGKAWQKTKDGKTPLQTAGAKLRVANTGTLIVARLDGHVARHHYGRVKGGIERAVLPTSSDVPAPMAKAVTKVLESAYQKHMGGG